MQTDLSNTLNCIEEYLRLNSSLVISLSALFFTVFSFWWMNWRKGRIIVTDPPSYTASGTQANLNIRIPLVFTNSGPTPIIIRDLFLFLKDDALPLKFIATSKDILHNNERVIATPFVLLGREAKLVNCEFRRQPGNLKFEEKTYILFLKALCDKSKRWKKLLEFRLVVHKQDLEIINSTVLKLYENLA